MYKYKSLFDSTYAANKTVFDTLAASGGGNQEYYDFQSILIGTLSMYEGTGDVTYLERVLTWAETMLSKATIVDARGWYNWPGPWNPSPYLPNGPGITYFLWDVQGSTELARLVHIIFANPTLAKQYGTRAMPIFNFVKNSVVDKAISMQGSVQNWYYCYAAQAGQVNGWTHNCYSDKAALLARVLIHLLGTGLIDSSKEPSYKDLLNLLLNQFVSILTSYTGNSLVWDLNHYDNSADPNPGCVLDHPIDISHGNRIPAMLVDALDAGITVTSSMVTGVANLWTNVMWNKDLLVPRFTNFIDGQNDVFQPTTQNRGPWGESYIYPGWSFLGAYDAMAETVAEAVLDGIIAGRLPSTICNDNNSIGITCLAGNLTKNISITRQGLTYYVSPSGLDTNPGTIDHPWKTIRKAHNTVIAGDTVLFRAGEYNIFDSGNVFEWFVTPERRGLKGKPITYAAYTGEDVYWLGGEYFPFTWDESLKCWKTAPLTGNLRQYLTGVTIKDGWPATPIRRSATCDKKDANPNVTTTGCSTSLSGVFLSAVWWNGLYNGSIYYELTFNDTTWQCSWRLYQVDGEWRITAEYPWVPATNYWHSPTLVGVYTGVGTYTGSPEITSADLELLPDAFVNPSTLLQPGTSTPVLVNGEGKLIFDLTYYDFLTQILYFKSNEIEPITDPNNPSTLCYTTTYDYPAIDSQPDPEVDLYVVFDGVKVYYGSCGFALVRTNQYIVRNCEIKHMFGQGFLSYTTNSLIENNVFDYIAGPVQYRNDYHKWMTTNNNKSRPLYFVGENSIIRNNFFGRSHGGDCAGLSSSGNEFYHNVCYGPCVGLRVYGQNENVYDNVFISAPDIWRGLVYTSGDYALQDYSATTNCSYTHNYCEGLTPLTKVYSDSTGLTIKYNIFKRSIDGVPRYTIDMLNVTMSAMDYNLYMSDNIWYSCVNGLYFNHNWDEWNNYWKGLGFEANSQFQYSDTQIDKEATVAFLETSPTIDSIQNYFRSYAIGVAGSFSDFGIEADPPPIPLTLYRTFRKK